MDLLKKIKMDIESLLLITAIGLLIYLLITRLNINRAETTNENKQLKIYDLVRSVKGQLENLNDTMHAKNEAALFVVKSFDLELNFVVRRSIDKNLGFESQVLTLGQSNQASNEQVQKITLHMEVMPTLSTTVPADTTVSPFTK